VDGASAGYRVRVVGTSISVTVGAGVTATEICGLGQGGWGRAEVQAEVEALGSQGASLPSLPSDDVIATAATVVDGFPADVAVDTELGVDAVLTVHQSALMSGGNSQYLTVRKAGETRTTPVPPGTSAILGFDAERNAVYLGVCSYDPQIIAASLSDLSLTRIPLPDGEWDACESLFDPQRRLLWLAPSLWANQANDVFDHDGGFAIGLSVDGGHAVEFETPILCRAPDAQDVWITNSARFSYFDGRVVLTCTSRNS
jgi:hypothetical protein